MTYLGVDIEDSLKELEDTRGCHARFIFLKNLHIHHLDATMESDGDDARVMHHRAYALRSYLMYLVDTSIFVDKGAYYVDLVYLRYFIYFDQTHEYKWGGSLFGLHVLEFSRSLYSED